MDVRKLLVILLVGLGLLTPSICAATQSITLPPKTATIAVAGDDWPYDGHPDTQYQLWIDPVTLRVGYDQESGLVYESFLVADMGDLINTGNGATLHLSTATATPGAIFAVTPLSLEHSVPEPMDFAWLSRLLALGDVMVIQDPYPFGLNAYEVWDGGGRYQAWYLGMNTGYGEFAGVGDPLHAPYTVITTVPEPSTVASLMIGLAALGFFVLVRRKESRSIAVYSTLVCVLVCGPSLADEWFSVDSEPGILITGNGLAAQFASTRDLPSDYTYLPTFPRLIWSFGCAPTSGAMIAGYLDNSGFPRMFF